MLSGSAYNLFKQNHQVACLIDGTRIVRFRFQNFSIMNKKTLVIGASENPARYSYLAVNRLRSKGNEVVAIGQRTGKLGDVEITKEKLAFTDVDTVTLYVNPTIQKQYYDYILSLSPKRIVFNPGTENLEFEKLAQSKGVKVLEACTLVLLSTGQY